MSSARLPVLEQFIGDLRARHVTPHVAIDGHSRLVRVT